MVTAATERGVDLLTVIGVPLVWIGLTIIAFLGSTEAKKRGRNLLAKNLRSTGFLLLASPVIIYALVFLIVIAIR